MLVSPHSLTRPVSALVLASTLLSAVVVSQQPVDTAADSKRALTHDDYDRWPSIRSTAYSADGKWFAYSVEPAVGDGYLFVQQVDGKKRHRHPRGTSPVFSHDGRYVVFTEKKSVVQERMEKLEKLRAEESKKPSSKEASKKKEAAKPKKPTHVFVILELATGKKERITSARSHRVMMDGRFVVHHERAPESKSSGSSRSSSASSTSAASARRAEMMARFAGRRGGRRGMRGRGGFGGDASSSSSGGGSDLIVRDLETGKSKRYAHVQSYQGLVENKWLLLTVLEKKEPKKAPAKKAAAPKKGAAGKGQSKEGQKGAVGQTKAAPKASQTAKMQPEKRAKKPAKKKPARKKPAGIRLKDGVHAISLADGRPRLVLAGKAKFGSFITDARHTKLAFTSDLIEKRAADAREAAAKKAEAKKGKKSGAKTTRTTAKKKEPRSDIWLWDFSKSPARRLVHAATLGMPEGAKIRGGVGFSNDASVLTFSIEDAPRPEMPKILPEEKVVVDIWHWNDGLIQPMQARQGGRTSRTRSCVLHLADERMVVLGDEKIRSVRMLTRDGSRGLAIDSKPYEKLVSHDARYSDYYIVNTLDGTREKVFEKARTRPVPSPSGRYMMLYGNDHHWYCFDVATKSARCLTKGIEVSFENELEDRPQPARAYGIAGWTKGEEHVFVYDRYDVWCFAVKGDERRCVTDGYGRANKTVFRVSNFDYHGDRDKLDVDDRQYLRDPLFLSANDERTKASGYYIDKIEAFGKPRRVRMFDARLGGLTRAKKADRVFFTLSRFDQFPDIWASDLSMKKTRKLTDACPEQRNVRWGKSELVSWKNDDGLELQGILIKPDGFDARKKYPMMVYFYERNSQNLHRYTRPAGGTSPNASFYVSNGYLWFIPDIVYTVGYPGESAEKCVISGVQSLIAKGFVDPKAIGIAGHSWGGYQTAHLVTRSNLFAAAESGAPVSNMFSAYGGIRYQSGMSRQFQYERTQSRIGGTPWEYPQRYWQNSPVFYADRVQTPVLILHNDNDGAVPWTNGIEYFMALRRLNKEAYLFNYNGEPHGLRKRANQQDWARRMKEFFDHHLKGAPLAKWMKDGVPYAEREREKIPYVRSVREAEAQRLAEELESAKPVTIEGGNER